MFRTSAAAPAAPVEVGGVKIAQEGEFSGPTVLEAWDLGEG
jgi:hypothetical protein